MSAGGVARRRGLSVRKPILKKEMGESGRGGPRASEVIPFTRPLGPRGGFRFRVAVVCGALLKLSGRHGADGRVRRV